MSSGSGPASASALDARLAAAGACVGIVGPAGTGKTRVLTALVELRRGRGQPLARCAGRRFGPTPYGAFDRLVASPPGPDGPAADRHVLAAVAAQLEGGGLLVVDDAQWLDPASLRVVAGLAEAAAEGGWQVVVAHRPAGPRPDLHALDDVLRQSGPIVRLGPLGRDEVAALASERLRAPATEELTGVLTHWSGGWPAWAERLVGGWAEEGVVVRGQLRRDPAERVPDAVVEVVEARLSTLQPEERGALVMLAVGGPDPADLLPTGPGAGGEATAPPGGDPGALSVPFDPAALAELRAQALVHPDLERVELVPIVAAAARRLVPRAEQDAARRHLARLAAARPGGEALAARHLLAANGADAETRQAFLRAGELVAPRDPVAALAWFERAATIPPPPGADGADGALDGRLAEALAAAGRADAALAAAEAGLRRGGPDADRARLAAAAILADRGLWERAAELSCEVTSHPTVPLGMARAQGVLCLAVAGRAAEAAALAAALPTASSGLAERAMVATALALVATLGPGHDDGVAALVEATALLEAAAPATPLALLPHEVGAALALASGDASLAEQIARRAAEHLRLPRPRQARLLLLAGWAAMRQGNQAGAEEALVRARPAAGSARDRVLALGLEAGLARRDGDVPRQAQVVEAASSLLALVPPDLLLLDALGELGVLLRRFGQADRLGGAHRSAASLLAELGAPPVWALPNAWAELAAAAAVPDAAAATAPAAEVARLAVGARRLAPLGPAARVWRSILDGEVDVAAVESALDDLSRVGLLWEASQLAGQAAIRVRDAGAARRLLNLARSLRPAVPGAVGDDEDEPVGRSSSLSDQERKVGRLVLDGLTHKEIGAQLYISPKTVEHHVARIRQKLGAGTRAEMLAALRQDVGA